MRIHVVYDSAFGNTQKVAHRIADVLGQRHEVVLAEAVHARPEDIEPGDVLVVGSPTQGGRPTESLTRFLTRLSDATLEGMPFAAFDTRVRTRWVRVFGYAAPRIARALAQRDAVPMADAEGFEVTGKEGPLAAGELERAAAWAAGLPLPVTH
jgi:flavodoxin